MANTPYNKEPQSIGKFKRSIDYAWQGIKYMYTHETNFKYHTIATLLVLIAAAVFKITVIELLFICSSIGAVLCAEALNTGIEKTIDLVQPSYHPLAKIAKDVSAAAVLIISFVAAIIGLIIFIPYIWQLI